MVSLGWYFNTFGSVSNYYLFAVVEVKPGVRRSQVNRLNNLLTLL